MKGLKPSYQKNTEKFGAEAGGGHIAYNVLKV
jgi:hypothetical protein